MVKEIKPISWRPGLGIRSPTAHALWLNNLNPYILNIDIIKEAPDGATELMTGITTDLNTFTTGSYIKADFISAAASDTNAEESGSVRKIKVWGIDRYYNYLIEECALSTSTAGSSTNTWRALNQSWASLHGNKTAEQDAKGAIHVGANKDITDEILVIAATANTTVSARTWIPKNWRAKIERIKMQCIDSNAGAGKSGAIHEIGTRLYPQYIEFASGLNEESDEDIVEAYHCHLYDNIDIHPESRIYGNDNSISQLTFYHQADNTARNADFYYGIQLILWPTRHLATSQIKEIREV